LIVVQRHSFEIVDCRVALRPSGALCRSLLLRVGRLLGVCERFCEAACVIVFFENTRASACTSTQIRVE
jgi:hypothetical protein